jgi:hypothetical protein
MAFPSSKVQRFRPRRAPLSAESLLLGEAIGQNAAGLATVRGNLGVNYAESCSTAALARSRQVERATIELSANVPETAARLAQPSQEQKRQCPPNSCVVDLSGTHHRRSSACCISAVADDVGVAGCLA